MQVSLPMEDHDALVDAGLRYQVCVTRVSCVFYRGHLFHQDLAHYTNPADLSAAVPALSEAGASKVIYFV